MLAVLLSLAPPVPETHWPAFLQETPRRGSRREQAWPFHALKNTGLSDELFQISEVSPGAWKSITKALSLGSKHLKSNLSISLPASPHELALE